MGTFFANINELRTIRDLQHKLSKREAELLKPILTDTKHIKIIYEWFKEILSAQEPEPCAESPNQRRRFIYVILCFYAPSVLVGEKMPYGLRDAIANAISTYSAFISQNISTIIFWYQNDKEFKQSVDSLYKEVELRIEEL